MAFVYADRVLETTATTGTGALTLGGTTLGYRTFSAGIGAGNETDVTIVDPTTGAWETCRATLTDATTLTRGALRASSTGSRIDFAAGTKQVFCSISAYHIQALTNDVITVSGATYGPALAQSGRYLRCTNAGGCVVTIPANSTEAYPIGTTLTIEQAGAVQVEVTQAGGVTVNVASTHTKFTAGQYAVVQVVKVDTDTWTLFGNLEAAP